MPSTPGLFLGECMLNDNEARRTGLSMHISTLHSCQRPCTFVATRWRKWTWLAALFLRQLAFVCAALMMPRSGTASSEVVVAMRYLKAQGMSHAQLYLFREDGRLLRRLTDETLGQIRNPQFTPSGEMIVFTRELPNRKEFWSIEPRSKNVQMLPDEPRWYRENKTSPFFTEGDEGGAPDLANRGPHDARSPIVGPPSFDTPNGRFRLVLNVTNGEEDQYNLPGHGRHYELRDLQTGSVTELGTLPGFEGLYGLLHLNNDKDQHFICEGPLQLAFFSLHLNSTDGDTCYALDMSRRRIVRLSQNWATPAPLPGEDAFLTFTFVRYVPLTGSRITANCSYLERWNDDLQRIRYGTEAAGVCYGASMYRVGKKPAVITIGVEGQ